jgi:subtilisin family serine protease
VHHIAALPFVRSVEPVRLGCPAGVVPIESPRPAGPGGAAAGGSYGFAEEQLAQIGITDMHGAGYTGDGIVIGVLDTGFVKTHEAYNEPGHVLDVIAEWDFINDDSDVGIEPGDPGSQHRHGTIVLGTIGGYRPGTYIGGAYDASFILAKTEDTADEQPIEEDYYVAGLEFIEANGGDVATSSLIYTAWYTWFDMDGLTAVTTIGVNAATDNGLACCTAAGNYGYDGDLPSIGAPADAFEVVTVGAVDDTGDMADFSSNGPTFDGRVKPEVVARGVSTASVDPDDDSGYLTANGTSLSTPLAASAVALLIEAHPDWTIPQIRTALFQTADYFVANGEPDPEFRRGYGLIDVFAASEVDFCNADLDGDGNVSTADLLELLGSWGPCPGCPADLDGDGDVSTSDLLILLGTWGPC